MPLSIAFPGMVARVGFFIACLLGAFLGQTAAMGQTGISMEVEIGIDNFVETGSPIETQVTIAAEVLFAGFVEVSLNNTTTRVAVEVPAGGSKQYDFVVPPIGFDKVARVKLLSTDLETLDSVTQQLNVVNSAVLVGVVDAPLAAAGLGRTRTEIDSVPVQVITLDNIDREPAPLGYIVWGRAESLPDRAQSWLGNGGRVIVDRANLAWLDLDTEPIGHDTNSGVDWLSFGNGEILVVETFDLEPDQWARVIRPTPIDFGPQQEDGGLDINLLQAASQGARSRIPPPWSVGLVVFVYGLVVAPINFFVLKKLNRRELAWFTVPALSILAVTTFWVLGRTRLGGTELSHASLVVDNGSGRPLTMSTLVISTGRAENHRLEVGEDSVMFVAAPPVWANLGQGKAVVDGNTIELEHPELGTSALRTNSSSGVLPVITIDETGSVTIENTTSETFDAFGLIGFEVQPLGNAPLPPGATAAFNGEFGGGFWPEDEAFWQMTNAAQVSGYNNHYFAFSDSHQVSVDLDGRTRTVSGPALYLVAVDPILSQSASGKAIAVPPGSTLESFGAVFADSVTVGFNVPTGVEPILSSLTGEPVDYMAWNWAAGAYEEVASGAMDPNRYVAINGEVVVKVAQGMIQAGPKPIDPGGGFVGSFTPANLRLTWESRAP